jgi:hypothetical protein
VYVLVHGVYLFNCQGTFRCPYFLLLQPLEPSIQQIPMDPYFFFSVALFTDGGVVNRVYCMTPVSAPAVHKSCGALSPGPGN